MKIIIGLILLALIYFIYKKVTGDKASLEHTSDASSNAVPSSATEAKTDTAADNQVTDTSTSGVASATAAVASAAVSNASNAASLSSSLPLEHLVGIDRRAGKALRALGITDMNALLSAGADKLSAAGFDAAAAKTLQAQAALSALPGVSPHEASVLASSGIDSITALASQDPSELLSKVARANKSTGALKAAPGVQQLQRLISSAKAAA